MKKLSRITNGFCEKKTPGVYRTVSKVVVPAAIIYFIIKFII